MVRITRPLQVVLVAAWAFSLAQAATIVLVDTNRNSVLRHVEDVQLDTKSLVVADAALLRLQPPFSASEASFDKISQLLSTGDDVSAHQNLPQYPTAFLFLNLVGLEGHQEQVLPSLESGTYSIVSADGASLSVLAAIQELAEHNEDVPFHRLDRFTAQDCDEACLSSTLQELAAASGGEYPQATSLGGVLKIGSSELDLQQPEFRLFAIELALFYRSAKAVLVDASSLKDVLVMDAVFSSLGEMGVKRTEGVKAILQVVEWIKSNYNAKNSGHFAYQIALLGQASTSQVEEAMQPVPVRRLLEASAADEDALSESFGKQAAAYAAGFLLIYFTLAGIYCLTSMEFKQDTLLYSKGKVD